MGHQTPVGLAAPSASTGANWAAPLPWGTNAAAWDPRTWLCKAAAAGWQRQEGDRMLGHTPAAMRKHGTPTPFLPHKAGPPQVPLPSLALPQEDTSAGHSAVQPPWLAEPSGTSQQLGQRNGCHCQHQSEGLQHVQLSPGGAEQAWGQAGLTLQEPWWP